MSDPVAPAGHARLVLLTTTPRVPAGLLTWQAWAVLREADVILARDLEHPLAPYLAEAGIGPARQVEDTAARQVEDTSAPTAPVLALGPDRRARALLRAARLHGTAVYLGSDDGDPGLASALAVALADGGADVTVESVPGSWDSPGARLLDLVAVMDRLRSPGGCPWDAEQTHASLVRYLVEEAYETVEAIEAGDDTQLREELGDLLLQVVFHARIGQERTAGAWTIDDVAAEIVAKLIRRHPHVFGDVDAPTAAHVEANWQRLKSAEKGRVSAVDGVPLAQPALSLAAQLLDRARRAGVDLTGVDLTGLDLSEDPGLGQAAYRDEPALGAALLGVVVRAAAAGLDAERALRASSRGLAERIRAVEGG